MFKYLLPIFAIVMGFYAVEDDRRERRHDAAFRDHGKKVEIQPITDYKTYLHYKQKSVFDEKKYTGVSYNAAISFYADKGRLITVPEQALPPAVAEASRNGQAVTIEYLPEDPTVIRWATSSPYHSGTQWSGYLLIVAGFYYLYRAWRGNTR